jgi:hypothetical protein
MLAIDAARDREREIGERKDAGMISVRHTSDVTQTVTRGAAWGEAMFVESSGG